MGAARLSIRLSLMLLCLSGCASQPEPQLTSDPCRPVLAAWQQTLAAQPHDAQTTKLDADGLFATNRFLSQLASNVTTPDQRREWLTLTWQLAQQERQVNYTNTGITPARQEAVEACAAAALATQQQRALAQHLPFGPAQLQVADDYHTWQRLLGAYPLARAFVRPRIIKEQLAAQQRFGRANPGTAQRSYKLGTGSSTLTATEAAQLLNQARQASALDLPRLAPAVLARFVDHYAPVWAIETRGPSDIPGRMKLLSNGKPAVDPNQPTLYVKQGWTMLDNQVLLQLNYMVWFDERPKRQPLDLYGGRLDGLIWRVTLLPNGAVLAYDAIHACGCYHQFFIVDQRLTPRPQPQSSEPLQVFSSAIPDALHQTVQVQLSHGEHAIIGVQATSTSPPAINLQLRHYNALRSLAHDNTRRSLFDANGLVPASRRLERFILWPMGVPSAGAMRQWGHHATAFIGRRHFDEPQLFDRLFTYTP